MSIPSASHSSTRATCRESPKSACSRARAAHTTHRWFGVWIPPTVRAAPAARAKRSRLATASAGTSGRAVRITDSTAQTGSSTKAVSGGEWKFVDGRSIVPSACWKARRERAARVSRSPASGALRKREPGEARAETSAWTRPAAPPAAWMPCSSRSAPRHGCDGCVSCRSRSAGMRASLARTRRAKRSGCSSSALFATPPLVPIAAPAAPAPASSRKRRRHMAHLVGEILRLPAPAPGARE
jgi:hypothetical protein